MSSSAFLVHYSISRAGVFLARLWRSGQYREMGSKIDHISLLRLIAPGSTELECRASHTV